MGLFDNKKERAAKKAYKNIVKQKTTLAARQAYADEAVKVASERARQNARRPTLFGAAKERLRERAREVVSGGRKTTPVKRRSVAKRRYAPVKRRSKKKVSNPTGPTTLDQAIYG